MSPKYVARHDSYNITLYKLGFMLCLGYLLFIPSGPFPIYITHAVKLDTLFAILLFLSLIFYVNRIFYYPQLILLSFLSYTLVSALSVVFSDDLLYSLNYFIIMVGYSLVSLIIPLVYVNKVVLFRGFLFVSSFIVALIINVLHFVFGFGYSHRFALSLDDVSAKGIGSVEGVSVVDPNMTAAGLALSMLIYLPFSKFNIMNLVYSLAIITAVIVLQSRSALLGIFSALVLSSMVIFVRQLVFRYGVKKSHLKIALLFAIAVLMFVVLADFFNIKVYDRFVDRFSHISSNSPRALLFYDVWYLLSDSIKNMLIGAGFMTTNPHNEVLRALSSTGLLGLFTYALFLYYLFMFTLKSSIINSRLFFSSLLIIVFTLVITQFYGYTKLLWVSWMFLLFNMVESKMLNSFRHCIGSSKYHRVGH